MDIDRDVIGVMLDREGKPYLKLGQVSTCTRIHVEALKPLRGGGDCGKNHFCKEEFRWATGLREMDDIQQFVRRESLNAEGSA